MTRETGLNRNQLKYIVVIAMVIDHIAWAFVPTASAAGMIMHFFGRLTGPVMAYFLAEGFFYTGNLRRYTVRLGVFALVSWIPFSLFETGTWPSTELGVIYTLFLGLLTLTALYVWNTRIEIKAVAAAVLLFLSAFGDWAYFDVIWPVIFVQYRSDPKKKWILYSAVGLATLIPFSGRHWWISLCNLGIYMVPFLIHFLYNGKAGSSRPFHKWFFYIFYPSHLLVLYFLKRFI